MKWFEILYDNNTEKARERWKIRFFDFLNFIIAFENVTK